MMRIWLDADSAPVLLRDFIVNFGTKNNAEVIFVANRQIAAKKTGFKMIVCQATKDSADNYIYENAVRGDLVITKDLSLAQKLLQKEILVINDRGTKFTASYINDHLKEREMNIQLADLGFGGSSSGYSETSFKKFRKTFQECIERLS